MIWKSMSGVPWNQSGVAGSGGGTAGAASEEKLEHETSEFRILQKHIRNGGE
jgi:hypothetical protein